MKRIAIMGLGLMGGSLGLALKAGGFSGRIAGYARRADSRAQALKRKAVDEVFEHPDEAVADADLVVFCVPILTIPELVGACRGGLKHKCVLTDVGSTKQELASRIEPLLRGTSAVYVGSHPIAGSEQQGLDAARGDLYEGAVVVVTPARGGAAWAVGAVKDFWQKLGCRVHTMSPEDHDRVVARTSHLPHLVAALVAGTAGRDGDARSLGEFCGPGFRDTTRVAEGSPEVWHDIIHSNRGPVTDELKAFKAELDGVLEKLDGGDFKGLQKYLEDSRAKRRALLQDRRPGDERGEP